MVQIAVGAAITPFSEPLAPLLVVDAGAGDVIVPSRGFQHLTVPPAAARCLPRACQLPASSFGDGAVGPVKE